MKTKITTLAAICVLGFIGTINVNAADYKNSNTNAVVEENKTTSLNLVASTEKTSFENVATIENVKFLLNDDAEANVDLQAEAQLVTKWVVDQEEARVVKKLIDEGRFVEFVSDQSPIADVVEANVDLQKEAQLATKLVVDQAEAKIIQKLIDDGKLAEFN
jgi:hypothetical protein